MIHVENGAVTIKGNKINELGADFCFLCKTLEKEGLLASFQVAYEIMRDDPESFQLLSSISYKKEKEKHDERI